MPDAAGLPTAQDLFDATFQVQIVALLVRDPVFAASVSSYVRPEHFGDVYNGKYLGAVISWASWWRAYDKADAPTLPRTVFRQWVREWLDASRGARDHHTAAWTRVEWDLFDAPITAADYVRQRALEWVQRREEMQCLADAKRYLDAGKGLEDFRLLDRVARIQAIPVAGMDVGLTVGLDPEKEWPSFLVEPPRYPIALGLPQLDAACSGGFGRQEHWVIAAPPNVGKTTTCASFAMRWVVRGAFVVFVSLEQRKEQIRDKFITSMVGVPAAALRDHPQVARAWYHYVTGQGGVFVVQEFPTGSASVADIEAYVQRLAAACRRWPDIVIVDYDELLKSTGSHAEYRHRIQDHHVQLRGFAVRGKHVSVTCSQTNRDSVEQEVVSAANLAESFGKAAVADGVVTLCQTADEHRDGKMRMFLAKNRHGEKFVSTPYRIDPRLARIEEEERRQFKASGFVFGAGGAGQDTVVSSAPFAASTFVAAFPTTTG